MENTLDKIDMKVLPEEARTDLGTGKIQTKSFNPSHFSPWKPEVKVDSGF